MKYTLAIILFLLITVPLLAQDDVDTTAVINFGEHVDPQATFSSRRYMEENVGTKKFDEKKWKEIIGDVNYQEKKEKEKKAEEKKKETATTPFAFKIDPGVMRIISFIVVFCLFAFILYYVAQNTNLKNKKKIRNMIPADVTGPVENIEELEVDGLLRQALQGGDLRMAVRIQYLILLKKLNEVGLITWAKDKTNRDYLSELYGRNDCYDHVRGLTLAYELVWYGERSVSNESFERLSGEFESVNMKIKDVKPGA